MKTTQNTTQNTFPNMNQTLEQHFADHAVQAGHLTADALSAAAGAKILSGIKVLDLTRVLAGPYCGMLLADMGATVYKIEVPKIGDDSRAFGPFTNGESVYYMNFNRGKIGCPINSIDRIVDDPGFTEDRNMFPQMDHPVAGGMRLTNNALKFAYGDADPVRPAPTLGQDNHFVYHELLGIDESEYEAYQAGGVF